MDHFRTHKRVRAAARQSSGLTQATGLGTPCSFRSTPHSFCSAPCLLSFHGLQMVGGHCAGPVVGGMEVPESEFLCKALTASWWGHKHKAEGERT